MKIKEDYPEWIVRYIHIIAPIVQVLLFIGAVALLGWKESLGIWFLLCAHQLNDSK